jgi:hypothetical protein
MPFDLLAVDPFDFSTVDAGATAWVMSAAALVMLATAGVAFFYSGRVRAKHVLSMLMQNFTVIAVVSLLWMAIGFTLALRRGRPRDRQPASPGCRAWTSVPGFLERTRW